MRLGRCCCRPRSLLCSKHKRLRLALQWRHSTYLYMNLGGYCVRDRNSSVATASKPIVLHHLIVQKIKWWIGHQTHFEMALIDDSAALDVPTGRSGEGCATEVALLSRWETAVGRLCRCWVIRKDQSCPQLSLVVPAVQQQQKRQKTSETAKQKETKHNKPTIKKRQKTRR